jgi:hypothetical protein
VHVRGSYLWISSRCCGSPKLDRPDHIDFSTAWKETIGQHVTARERLVTAAMAIIFVALPRLVGPTAKPSFSHARKCRPASLPPVGAARDGGVPTPRNALFSCPLRTIAENAGDRSDRLDTSWAVPATAAPSAESTIPHSAPRVCLAAAFPAHRAVAERAAAVLTPRTLRY